MLSRKNVRTGAFMTLAALGIASSSGFAGTPEEDAQLRQKLDRMSQLVEILKKDGEKNEQLQKTVDELTDLLKKMTADLKDRTDQFEAQKAAAVRADAARKAAEVQARRAIVDRTDKIGGPGGDIIYESKIAPVRSFTVYHGNFINSLSLNGAPLERGVTGGVRPTDDNTTVTLNDGERISSIDVEFDGWIDAMTFHSSTGRSWHFGGNGGNPNLKTTVTIPAGREWVGISGLGGEVIDSLRIHYRDQ